MEDPKDDVSMNRAPLAGAQYAREKELSATMDGLKAPEPEVDNDVMAVPRAEMMAPLPAERADVHPWKPDAPKHID